MIRTYRYPLKPSKEQAATLESWRVACQQLYNGALQERRDAWKRAKVSIGYNDQTKSLTELRKADAEWQAVPALVARSALARIDRAFSAFFRRVKTGDKPGFPRFKSRAQYGSIGIGNATIKDSKVNVPKLGPVPFFEYRALRGTVKNVELRKEPDGWFVCIQSDLGPAPAKAEPLTETGIDLGLTSLAVLSTGEAVANPRHLANAQDRIARLSRDLARKQRGSVRRHKARAKLARAHQHVANCRKDFARKLACDLFSRFDLVAHENLNVKGLAGSVLARPIHDAAWTQILRCLSDKAESAGRHLVGVDPRGTTIECSGCGNPVPKLLSERMHVCTVCGLVLERDHNAAINVLNRVPAGLRVHARGGRPASCEASSLIY